MNKLTSKIQLQTALMLARDLQALRAGDLARFDRMVDSHGKGMIKPEEAIKTVQNLCGQASEFFPVTARMLSQYVTK